MDPNACLHQLREVAEAVERLEWGGQAEELADLFQSLDQWLSTGGFIPEDWNPANKQYWDGYQIGRKAGIFESIEVLKKHDAKVLNNEA